MGEKQPSTQHLSWKVLNLQNPSFQETLWAKRKMFQMDVAGGYKGKDGQRAGMSGVQPGPFDVWTDSTILPQTPPSAAQS